MKKVVSLIGLSAVLLAANVGAPALVEAQATKSKVKAGAKQAATQAKIKWESLAAEQQQQVKDAAKVAAAKAKQKWDSLSPEQQQQAIEQMKVGAAQLSAWWAKLPP